MKAKSRSYLLVFLVTLAMLFTAFALTPLVAKAADATLSVSASGEASWEPFGNEFYSIVVVDSESAIVMNINDYGLTTFNLKNRLNELMRPSGDYRITVYSASNTKTNQVTYSYSTPHPVMDAPSNLTWNGAVASWESVAHASKFKIELIDRNGSLKLSETVTAKTYDFTAYFENGAKFRVSAMADGYVESDFAQSAAAESFLIKFLSGSGSGTKTNAIAPPSGAYEGPTPAGFYAPTDNVFRRWHCLYASGPDAGEEFFLESGESITLTGDVLATAQWKIASYTVTFQPNNGGLDITPTVLEDQHGTIALPECSFQAPAGKEFDCWAFDTIYGTRYTPGQGYAVQNDVTFVALWKDKAFSASPASGTVMTGNAHPISYTLSVTDAERVIVQFWTGSTWELFYIFTAPVPAAGTPAQAQIDCPAQGWTGTRTLRLVAQKLSAPEKEYYSDSFTVEWVESVYAEQPQSVTVGLDRDAYISFTLSKTPTSVRLERYNGEDWEWAQAAEADHVVISPASYTEGSFRIAAYIGENRFESAPFTVTWSEAADYSFTTQPVGGALAPLDALNTSWAVSFPVTKYEILIKEGDVWTLLICLDGYAPFKEANVIEDYDFELPDSEGTYEFKIAAYQGDALLAESEVFAITWADYGVSFDANGGSGTLAPEVDQFGGYILPDNPFEAPVKKVFKGWTVNGGSTVYQPGEEIDIICETTVSAAWEDYTYVDTYEELIDAIESGRLYIVLEKNVSFHAYNNSDFANAMIVFDGLGQTVLDLDGKVLEFINDSDLMTNEIPWIEVSGGHKLTVRNGSLCLTNNSQAIASGVVYGMIYVNGATLVTEKVDMTSNKSGSCVFAQSGSVTLNGGTLQALNTWTVYVRYASLTLDGGVKLKLQNYANASASLSGGLYIMTAEGELDILNAEIHAGAVIPKTLYPTLSTHVIYTDGAFLQAELGVFATNAAADTAGAASYWLDQGTSVYLAQVGATNYDANECTAFFAKSVKYAITVENGTASVGGNPVSQGYYTQTITVTALSIPGKIFREWVYTTENGSGIIFANDKNATTTFNMCDEAITVTALYDNQPIKDVSITFDVPAAGDALIRDAEADGEGFTFNTKAHGNADWDIQWNDITVGKEIVNIENGIFLPGHTYEAMIQVKPLEGYRFESNEALLVLRINGQTATYYSHNEQYINLGITVVIPDDFKVYFDNTTHFGLGGEITLDTDKMADESTEFANASEITYAWFKNGVRIDGEDDDYYTVRPEDAGATILVVVYADGYVGASTATVVNEKIQVISLFIPELYGGTLAPDTSIISFFDRDLVYCLSFKIADDEDYTLRPGVDALVTGKTYSLWITVAAKDGYALDLDGADLSDYVQFSINGGAPEVHHLSGTKEGVIYVGYIYEMTVNMEHTHTYDPSIYGFDEDYHWYRCTDPACANPDEEEEGLAEHKGVGATCVMATPCFCGCTLEFFGDHDFLNGVFVKTTEEYHEVQCAYCTETDGIENPHFGGTATCTTGKICEGCNAAYGAVDLNNHTGEPDWIKTAQTHKKAYTCCGTVSEPEAAHTMVAGVCSVCNYGCLHTSLTPKDGLESTCTQAGYKSYFECSLCHDLFADAEAAEKIDDLDAWKAGAGKLEAGHTFGAWTPNGDGTHTRVCSKNAEHTETLACHGGEATCSAKAICDDCGGAHGAFAQHSWGAWTSNGNDTHTRVCTANAEHKETLACHGGEATCLAKAICDDCGGAHGSLGAHTPDSTWGYKAANGHAKECAVCGENCPIEPHTPNIPEATEEQAKLCTDCGYTIAAPLNHSHSTTPVAAEPATCTVPGNVAYFVCGCGMWFEDAEATREIENHASVIIPAAHDFGAWTPNGDGTHTRVCSRNAEHKETLDCHGGEATCSAKAICDDCGGAHGNLLAHTPGAAATCTAAQKCSVCEAELSPALGHTPGAAATCTAAQKCSVCEAELSPALGHKYDNDCDASCNTCAAERTPAEHKDADEDRLCDVCGAELPRKGLSTGAIIGIAAGSTVVLGTGGFSLVWFVIKKKSFAELLGIFKK